MNIGQPSVFVEVVRELVAFARRIPLHALSNEQQLCTSSSNERLRTIPR